MKSYRDIYNDESVFVKCSRSYEYIFARAWKHSEYLSSVRHEKTVENVTVVFAYDYNTLFHPCTQNLIAHLIDSP